MTVLYVLLAILILLLMVTIHEFGHYIVGKILKFKINEFSIGFGPKIFSRKSRKTGEVFSLRLLPLGGYCAFAGEDDVSDTDKNAAPSEDAVRTEQIDVFDETQPVAAEAESIKPVDSDAAAPDDSHGMKLFNEQKPWKRILVLIAGAAFNFVSAIIFAFIFLCAGGNVTAVVVEKKTDELGNEYNIALMEDDRIVAVDGVRLNVMNSFASVIAETDADTVVLTVVRNGETLDVTVTRQEIYDAENGNYVGFGFTSGNVAAPMDIVSALVYCVPYTFELSWTILGTLGQLLTGQLSFEALSGPVTTVKFMADAARQNWLNILLLLSLISANLAIFNVLPIPALDGSKIVFTAIEWIRGKPINRTVEAYIHAAGLFLLLGLCIVVELFHFIG